MTTLFDWFSRFEGVHEYPGDRHHPLLMAALGLRIRDGKMLDFDGWPEGDEVAWCGAIMQLGAYSLGLPVPRLPLRARSWMTVGEPIQLSEARTASDIVIFARGGDVNPDVLDAPGHVGCYAGHFSTRVIVLGGNQANAIKRSTYLRARVLGVRRL